MPISPPERAVAKTAFSRLMWLLGLMVTLLLVRYGVPHFAEELQYSITRGKQRAQFEVAREGLHELPLQQLSKAYQMVSHRVGPSVVHINVTADSMGDRMGDREQPPTDDPRRWLDPERFSPDRFSMGQGAGVIVDHEGYIVTNRHVVDGSDRIRVKLSDGRTVPAQVVGVDSLTDLAVLKVEAGKLIAAEWGDSDELEVGALVWAVGSPFGLERSITFGILSAKNRADKAGTHHQDFLQTDAAVNPGNSGGPLVDTEGRVIGINTAIVGSSYQGISFAIPSSVARSVYERLKASGHVVRGWLGVQLAPLSDAHVEQAALSENGGARVVAVVDNPLGPSPAGEAGLQAGDVITAWDGHSVASPSALSQRVAATEIGTPVLVTIVRDGSQVMLEVIVGERPARFSQ